MNKLAKKYKQMRKSGEYTGGLSTDAQPRFGTNVNLNATKASGIADRFGPAEKLRLDNGGFKPHRRVKSGVSDNTA